MLRYGEVVVGEAKRMRVARISRGDDPRFLWQAGATARSVGTLFIRSYERGERVHLAMVSRGWTGSPGCARRRSCPRLPAAPALEVSQARVRLPGRAPGVVRRRPARSSAANGSRCSARTARARPRSPCTSTEFSAAARARSSIAGLEVAKQNLREIRRRVGLVFQDPDDQLFCPTVRRGRRVRPAQLRPVRCGRTRARGAARRRHGVGRGPLPAAPVRRPAPPGRAGVGAGLRSGDPGAGRAVGEPGTGGPPRTRRAAALVGPHHAHGHARPAVRAADLPAQRADRRRRGRRGRPHPRDPRRRRLCWRRHRLELPYGFRLD